MQFDSSSSPGQGARSQLLLSLLTVVLLAPFANRALHVDDPLFVWSAQQILRDPLDFYGFDVNWYGHEMPASQVIKNPPLVSYWLAAVGALGGFGEVALHLGMLVPALLLALGTYRLAARLCARPLLATLCVSSMPVVLLSETSLMCDITMLALFVWAVLAWLHAERNDDLRGHLIAGALVTACALSKYFGAALIPLLALHSLKRRRRAGAWCIGLALPCAVGVAYYLASRALYGRALPLDAAAYALDVGWSGPGGLPARALVGLSFAGGCLLSAHVFAPWLWSRRVVALAVALAALAIWPLSLFVDSLPTESYLRARWPVVLTLAAFALGGVHVLALAAGEFLRRRDPATQLLALWLLGSFVFAFAINWTINGRSLLPMSVPLAILLVRRLDVVRPFAGARAESRLFLALLPALGASLLVTGADASLAGSARSAAEQVFARHAAPGRAIWFQGHWGFQYYMQQHGGTPIDESRSRLERGALVAVPQGVSSNVAPLPEQALRRIDRLRVPLRLPAAALDPTLGAGFYSDLWGPLPFALGFAASQDYTLLEVLQPLELAPR